MANTPGGRCEVGEIIRGRGENHARGSKEWQSWKQRQRDSVRKMWGRRNNLLLVGEEMHSHLHRDWQKQVKSNAEMGSLCMAEEKKSEGYGPWTTGNNLCINLGLEGRMFNCTFVGVQNVPWKLEASKMQLCKSRCPQQRIIPILESIVI